MSARPIAAAAVLAAAIVSGVAAQRFQSRAELVLIDVLVLHDRRPVTGLVAQDFEILDSGVPQRIEQVYVERLPVNVIMVLDTSGSVAGERLGALQAGAVGVVDRLRDDDRAAVLTFSQRLDLPAALTGDRAALRAAIGGLAPSGSTALRDAAFAGLALRGADARRTLLLLFSDGIDTISILDERSVLEIARRSDATVYAIGIRDAARLTTEFGRTRLLREGASDNRFLERLARETGGRLFYAEQNREIARTFAGVLDEFNSRYVLGYAPTSSAAGWHPVEVKLKKRAATLIARRGYFAE